MAGFKMFMLCGVLSKARHAKPVTTAPANQWIPPMSCVFPIPCDDAGHTTQNFHDFEPLLAELDAAVFVNRIFDAKCRKIKN